MTEFVFDEMTSELRACIEHGQGFDAVAASTYPAVCAARVAWEATGKLDDVLKDEYERLSAAHYAGLDAYRSEGKRLRGLVQPELLTRYERSRMAWLCRDETREGDPKEHVSPSGRYRLTVTVHKTGRGTWACTKGVMFGGDRKIETVHRNYSSFPFLFVEDHPGGHDYLVCGYDYQGQTIVELDTGRRIDFPPGGPFGGGFCWSSYTASPSKRTLAVDGCYWGHYYETILVDFDAPMNGLPVLYRNGDESSLIGWTGPDACSIGVTYEVYVPTGTKENEMSDEECDDCDRRRAAGETGLFRMVKNELVAWDRSQSAGTEQ